MSATTVFDVVEAFSPALRSVDVRTVAVKPEDKWINVVTSVFLIHEEEKKIKFEQQQIREGISNTDRFRILLTFYSVERLPLVFGDIEKGRIKLHRTFVVFRQFNPYELSCNWTYPSYLKRMDELRLIGAESRGKEEERRNLWPIVERQNGAARRLGYKDIYEQIGEILRIHDFVKGRPNDFILGIPMPARIIDVSVVGSTVKIKTEKIQGLTNLQLNIHQKRHSYRTGEKTLRIQTKPIKTSSQPLSVTHIPVSGVKPYDWIEVELIHRQVPSLSLDTKSSRAPLENVAEPFIKAVSSFCSLDLFKRQLFSPEHSKKPGKDFENAVAWLLSLVGFSVIPLGRFENLKIPKTKYEVGSVDMIAYRENECLLFVDCDTSIPNEKKIRTMVAVKDHFRFLQNENKQPRVNSVIFCPRDCSRVIMEHHEVKIADKHMITRIFEEVMKGNLEDARNSIWW